VSAAVPPPRAVARDLKRRILQNAFPARLKELRVDRTEYLQLCEALEELARRWRGRACVDREVAAALHALSAIIREVIPALARSDPFLRDEMEDMEIRLEALVRRCLGSGPWGGECLSAGGPDESSGPGGLLLC